MRSLRSLLLVLGLTACGTNPAPVTFEEFDGASTQEQADEFNKLCAAHNCEWKLGYDENLTNHWSVCVRSHKKEHCDFKCAVGFSPREAFDQARPNVVGCYELPEQRVDVIMSGPVPGKSDNRTKVKP